jgi:hypothetical protein
MAIKKRISESRIARITEGLDAKLRALEDEFAREVQAFYNSKIAPLQTVVPADSIRRKYEIQIKNKIRARVEEAYRIGAENAAREIRRIDPEFQLFTSKSDTDAIHTKTNELNEKFWKTITYLTERKNAYIVKQNKLGETQLELKPQFEEEAHLLGIASFIIFAGFNKGVKTKTLVAKSLTPTPPPTPPPAPPPKPKATATPMPSQDLTLTIRRLSTDLLYLTAEDDKVCTPATNSFAPCSPLNRTVYDADEPGIPELPRHRYCHCKLIPIVNMTHEEVRNLTNPR